MSKLNSTPVNSAALTDAGITPDKQTFFQSITEDWWAVILGSISIAVVLWMNSQSIVIGLPVYKWSTLADLSDKILSTGNLLRIVETGLIFTVLAGSAILLSGGRAGRFAAGFACIYLLATLSFIIGGNQYVAYYGLEYVVFALLIGIVLGNLVSLPEWFKVTVRSEFYIKTGLVILGTTILSADLIKAGLPGIIQAVIVVSAVFFLHVVEPEVKGR